MLNEIDRQICLGLKLLLSITTFRRKVFERIDCTVNNNFNE